MLCRGFSLYLAKRLHYSIEIKPYSFKLSARLMCHHDRLSLSKSGPRTYLGKYTGAVSLDFDGSIVGSQMGDDILIHLLSLVRISQFLR